MPADTLDATRLQILQRPTTNRTSQEPDQIPYRIACSSWPRGDLPSIERQTCQILKCRQTALSLVSTHTLIPTTSPLSPNTANL